MTEVNKERVQLLVDALLSGEHVQGFGVLERITDGGVTERCCLGVACRVAMANGVVVGTQTEGHEGSATFFDSSSGTLPWSVQTWFGFDSESPNLLGADSPDNNWTAIDMNDNRREPFALIAQRFKLRYIDDTDEATEATQREINRLQAELVLANTPITGESLDSSIDY